MKTRDRKALAIGLAVVAVLLALRAVGRAPRGIPGMGGTTSLAEHLPFMAGGTGAPGD